jgi:transposase
MIKEYDINVWTKDVAFYLDGVSFTYKKNPKDQAVAPTGRVWRKANEGLIAGCTAKGKKCGTGGKTLKLIVAISYGKGVICCEYYEKMDGTFFASFAKNKFKKLMKKSGKRSRLWVQDGDPSQNSAAVKRVISSLKCPLLAIPPRSPDLNPIENIFHLVRKQLDKDALAKDISCESMNDFKQRIKATFMSIPQEIIDKTIFSMSSRIKGIIREKGKRLKY